MRHAEKLARIRRWLEPAKARVSHPDRGEIIVPAGSSYAACLCAADVWGCEFADIWQDAKVTACDQSLPITMPTDGCGRGMEDYEDAK